MARKFRTTEEFIEKAIIIHSNTYDYSLVDYKKSRENVIIICNKHGEFKQEPSVHLNKKSGCPKCGVEKHRLKVTLTLDEILIKLKNKHGDKFDYSGIDFKDYFTPVTFRCRIHNENVTQTLSAHFHSKNGCLKCRKDAISNYQKNDTKYFIEKSEEVHGDFYNYENSVYIKSTELITITCPIHGDFEQLAQSHMKGSGCKKCALLGNSVYNTKRAMKNGIIWKKERTTLYFLEFVSQNEKYLKVGISKEFDIRLRTLKRLSQCEVNQVILNDLSLYDAVIVEQAVLKEFESHRHTPSIKFPGHTECLSFDIKNKVLERIKVLIKKQSIKLFLQELKSSYHLNEMVYTQGSCFRLYSILVSLLPEIKPWYSHLDDHWILEFEDSFYDINGEISKQFVINKKYELITDSITLSSAKIPTYERQCSSYSKYC